MKVTKYVVPMIMISLASMTLMQANGSELYGKPTVTVAQPKIVIRKGPVLVKKITKPKLFSGKPQKVSFSADDWDDEIEVDDVITSYRREDLNKIEHNDEVPEHIRWKLFLARQAALLAYKQKWS